MDSSSSETFRLAAAALERAAASSYVDDVSRAIALIDGAFAAGRKLLVFGNGGSSADAQHLVAELVGRFAAFRRALPAIALTTNQALLTAWSNDRSFDEIFSRQIEALGVDGDVALGITTSGQSPNVLYGLRSARARGLRTIALTGERGRALRENCDVLLVAPATDTPRVQEIHLATYHAMCEALERRVMQA